MNLFSFCGTRWRVSAAALCLLSPSALLAQAPPAIRVTQWNVTNFTTSPSRNSVFQTAIYGINPANNLQMAPDLFLGEEFTSASALPVFLNMLNTAPGSPGDWAAAPWSAGNEFVPDTNTAVFYRTSKFNFVRITLVSQGSTSTSTPPRNTYRYDLQPKGFINDVPTLSCYVSHFKAQGGTNDGVRRLVEAQRIRANSATLTDPNTYFLIGGDFNVITSSAPEYQALVGTPAGTTAAGQFYDPINTPGAWNNNGAYRFVHTQEPSTQMDDRHDQILLCSKLLDNTGFDYVYNDNGNPILNFKPAPYSTTTWNDLRHSYRSWGNDGTSYNVPLKIAGNTMVGAAIAQALVTSVQGNGHLPVFLDLKLPVAYVHLSGTVLLEAWSGGAEPIEFQFRPANGGLTITRTLTVGADGAFSFTDIPAGSYTVAVKGRHWLRKTQSVNGSTQNVTGLTFLLLNGDVNGNNVVDVDDLTALLNVYNTSRGDGIYNELADLDGNGRVDVDDLTLLLNNFNTNGQN